jgi:UDP-N-acetylglucosamine 1-carboxyvinyltransferase
MDRIRIAGGNKLNGEIHISGAKNAALPLMIASLLTPETLTLRNLPRLADVQLLKRILHNHGVDQHTKGRRAGETVDGGETVNFTAAEIADTTAPYHLVSRMRASFWVLGPLLARCHEARVSLPGGCAIGTRPVDLYLSALREMGADIEIDQGYVVARAPGGLKGATINFPKVSVGATHVTLMAATLARGRTVIENAAREPEVSDVANCLVKMGAKIDGIGTSTLTIDGVAALHGATHSVLADRIETGTYAMAVAMTGGDVMLRGRRRTDLQAALDVLAEAGAEDHCSDEGIRWRATATALQPGQCHETQPFPGFPTDLQAQFMALMTKAGGTSVIPKPFSRTASCTFRNWPDWAPTLRLTATRLP